MTKAAFTPDAVPRGASRRRNM